jgi:hypothetical protein
MLLGVSRSDADFSQGLIKRFEQQEKPRIMIKIVKN